MVPPCPTADSDDPLPYQGGACLEGLRPVFSVGKGSPLRSQLPSQSLRLSPRGGLIRNHRGVGSALGTGTFPSPPTPRSSSVAVGGLGWWRGERGANEARWRTGNTQFKVWNVAKLPLTYRPPLHSPPFEVAQLT